MACNQTLSGIPRDCEGSIGGVKRVLFINRDQLGALTVGDTGIVTDIATTESAKFYEFFTKKNTATFTTAMLENRSYQSTLAITIERMTASKRVQVMALLHNELSAIVEDNNGVYWLIGDDVALEATATDVAATGAAFTDTNAYTLTLTDTSRALPKTVDASIIDGLIG